MSEHILEDKQRENRCDAENGSSVTETPRDWEAKVGRFCAMSGTATS